jgi:DNA primase
LLKYTITVYRRFFAEGIPIARIPDTEIKRLKEEVSVERLVEASGVVLNKAGKDMLGRCPFHDDAEASLVVTVAKNLQGSASCRARSQVSHFP